MSIPRDQRVRGGAGEAHTRHVQEEPSQVPWPSAVNESTRNAAAAAVGVTILNQIGRRLHIVDGQIELCEIIQRLEGLEPYGGVHADLQPCGPLSTEPTVAIENEQATDSISCRMLASAPPGA
jgi:hypothetical protein